MPAMQRSQMHEALVFLSGIVSRLLDFAERDEDGWKSSLREDSEQPVGRRYSACNSAVFEFIDMATTKSSSYAARNCVLLNSSARPPQDHLRTLCAAAAVFSSPAWPPYDQSMLPGNAPFTAFSVFSSFAIKGAYHFTVRPPFVCTLPDLLHFICGSVRLPHRRKPGLAEEWRLSPSPAA